MKSVRKKILLSLLVCLVIIPSSLLSACSEETTPTSTPTTSTSTPTAAATWWEEKWGEPQYGGTITYRLEQIDDTFFDGCNSQGMQMQFWQETLFGNSMTVDRNEYSFGINIAPTEYRSGWLAESWEQTDPTTVTVHLHQGIHWQDKEPVNGREFTAYDVEYTWDRVMGTGSGFTEPATFYPPIITAIEKVTALDDYTLEFKINQLYDLAMYEVMGPFIGIGMTPHEWIELGEEGQNDWHNAIGTGPFILTDLLRATSVTCTRNPDYWGYDERYPDNQLPYADEIKIISIPDITTALAALRTGQIDILAGDVSHITLAQAVALAESDPNIQQAYWVTAARGVSFKYEVPPFDDIRVRKALQLAVNIPEIAEAHYKDTTEGVPTGTGSPLFGEEWSVPYDQWPAELQAEYSYDPEKAKELLAEAAADGAFEVNEYGGFDTEVIVSNTDDVELLQIIQAYFLAVGVDMEIKASDKITIFNLVHDRKFEQMVFAEVGGMTSYPAEAILKFTPTSMQNQGGVDDPAYMAFVEQFQQATTLEEAQEVYREADMYALEQHWSVRSCAISIPQAYREWLKGYSGECLQSIWTLRYFHYMWIDQSLKD